MGWAAGQEILDPVVKEVLKLPISDTRKRKVITVLVDALRQQDWDTESDSRYYNHALVKPILNSDEDE
jgi:hypothetical protein